MTTLLVSILVLLTLSLWAYAFWVRYSARKTVRAAGVDQGAAGRVRKAEAAHAARARRSLEDDVANRDVFLPDVITDMFDSPVDTRDKYVGIVAGSSCKRFGFHDGALFLGDRIRDDLSIDEGDFVVVDGPAAGSNVSRRIRRVAKIGTSMVEFVSDESGKAHRPRDRGDIIAKITHILA